MAQCLHRPNATLMSKRHPFGRYDLEENVNAILNALIYILLGTEILKEWDTPFRLFFRLRGN